MNNVLRILLISNLLLILVILSVSNYYLYTRVVISDNKLQAIEKNLSSLNDETKTIGENNKITTKNINETTPSSETLGTSTTQNSVENSKATNDLKRKVGCLELIKKTPDRGNARYIGIDIVGFYKDIKEDYENVKQGKFSREDDVEDNKAELKFTTEVYNEAKPLYENYLKNCE